MTDGALTDAPVIMVDITLVTIATTQVNITNHPVRFKFVTSYLYLQKYKFRMLKKRMKTIELSIQMLTDFHRGSSKTQMGKLHDDR